MSADGPVLLSAVLRSVQLKAQVVSADEREAGQREILNFGHTYGHALESAAEYRIGHGTAVAAGMVLEARLGERLGITEPGTADRIEEGLAPFGLGSFDARGLEASQVLGFLRSDKKVRAGTVRFVLLSRAGQVFRDGCWSHEVPGELVAEVLEEGLARWTAQLS
jgi:3-dehydroquinate synthetase